MSEIKYKSRYERLHSQGLCVICGKEMDRDGVYCSVCLIKEREEHRKNREFYLKMGICIQCRKEKIFGDEKRCVECRAKNQTHYEEYFKNQTQEYYDRRNAGQRRRSKAKRDWCRENGICTYCTKRKTMDGYLRCPICRENDKIKSKNYRLRKNGEAI